MRLFYLLFIGFFTGAVVSAQSLFLTDQLQTYDGSKYLQYFADTNSDKSFEDIKTPTIAWKNFEYGHTPNMGATKNVYWFTFVIQNQSSKPDWIIHVDYRTLDDVSIFVCEKNGVLRYSEKQGILTKNIYKQRGPVFPVSLEKNALVRIYMRVQTSSLLIFPVKISTPMAFSEIENEQRDLYLPALGILVAALLFNLVLLATSREKAYLFLSLSIAFEICFISAIVGLFYEYIAFDPPIILQKLRFIFAGLVYGFHVLFAFYYLNLKNYKTIWMAELVVICFYFLFSFLAGAAILNPYFSGLVLVRLNILFFLIQFIIAGYLTYKKAPMAGYYLFSFTPVILAMLLYIFVFTSILEANLFFSNSGLYASALFTILLTSGLTEKMIKVKHERARANQLEIDKIALNSEIERRMVVENHLKELNLTKDKFFSIIAHDLVNPFHAMILYSKELKVFTAGNERAKSYNNNLLLTAQNTYNLLQNLLTWSRAQTRQISFNPQPINLGDIINETVSNALSIAESKQIEIINEAAKDIQIEADVQMITLILRNLISNSIKFSFRLGLVKIQSQVDENEVIISIIDKGTGMESNEINKLFNMFETNQLPGTAGEAGTGLGLVICHEFVKYHGGNIQVKSEPGQGSIFTIKLPIKQIKN